MTGTPLTEKQTRKNAKQTIQTPQKPLIPGRVNRPPGAPRRDTPITGNIAIKTRC